MSGGVWMPESQREKKEFNRACTTKKKNNNKAIVRACVHSTFDAALLHVADQFCCQECDRSLRLHSRASSACISSFPSSTKNVKAPLSFCWQKLQLTKKENVLCPHYEVRPTPLVSLIAPPRPFDVAVLFSVAARTGSDWQEVWRKAPSLRTKKRLFFFFLA